MTPISETQDIAYRYLEYVGRIVENNPTKDLQLILNRSDVKSFWEGLIKPLKGQVPQTGNPEFDSKVSQDLGRIFSDMKSSLDSQAQEVWEGVTKPASYHDDPMNGVDNVRLVWGRRRKEALLLMDTEPSLRKGTLRWVFAQQAADAEVTFSEQIEQWAVQGVLTKTWKANFIDNVPCKECAALHGVTVPLHSEFPHGSTPVYVSLQSPPRHPRCKCVLSIGTMINLPGQVPESTSSDSVEPAQELPSASPVAPAQTLDQSSHFSSQEVRKMPRKRFTALLMALLAIILRFRKKR